MLTISIAASGLMEAQSRFARSAETIARFGGEKSEGDLATAVVDTIGAEASFKANIAVIRTADAMTKRLLDLRV